jgi:hypothetical protein
MADLSSAKRKFLDLNSLRKCITICCIGKVKKYRQGRKPTAMSGKHFKAHFVKTLSAGDRTVPIHCPLLETINNTNHTHSTNVRLIFVLKSNVGCKT